MPVEMVSHEDAEEFCRKLSALEGEKKAGRVYRLPTEAEWEYACRGGAASYSRYHFGDSISAEQANFGRKVGKTTEVGSYPPNAWGLYDMHGNVWEYCSDRYDDAYYGKGDIKDPQGPQLGVYCVLRGGWWDDEPVSCRAASRSRVDPGRRHDFGGFRVCFAWTS